MGQPLGKLFLWNALLAAGVLLVIGAVGIYRQTPATAEFTPYLLLVLAMPLASLGAWLQTRERGAAQWVSATINFRRRFRTLVALGILWVVICFAVVVHFHLIVGHEMTALSVGSLLGHLAVGWVVWVLLRRTARRTRFLDDANLTLDTECQIGGRVTAFVAQPVRRPVGLTKWEIALVCEKTRRGFPRRVRVLVHEDRREVVAGRVAHRGEILHGGGAFDLPVSVPPGSGPGAGLPRVDWHVESCVTLEGVGTFASRFPVAVEAAPR